MPSTPELPVRVITHNIRHDYPDRFDGEKPWPERKQGLINEFEYHTRYHPEAFLCLQEVMQNQLEDLLAGVNPKNGNPADQWVSIGVGRDDGAQSGDQTPIFYRPSVWNLQHWETVWLSETPTKPSKNWDSDSIRLVTIGVFTHRQNGKTVLGLNTHLDDKGSRARAEGAKIISAKVQEYQQGKFGSQISGTFLAGDFNCQEHEDAYLELMGPAQWRDVFKLVDPSRRYGDHDTYTSFKTENEPPCRIDFILLAPKDHQNWRVDGYSVLASQFDDQVWISDHRAVVADLTLVA